MRSTIYFKKLVLKLNIIALIFAAFSVNAVTLNVLEWEGYISSHSADFEAYAKQQGMNVELNILPTYITTPEQIFTQMRAKKADVTTPTHNYYKMDQGKLIQVLQPIDFSKLSNYSKVLGSLRNASYDTHNGGKYSVPLLGGSYGLAYNKATTEAPDSWNVLWDPKYKGRFEVTDDQFEANVYITLLVLGYSPDTFYDVGKSNLDRKKVQDKLNQLAANAGGFWGGLADAGRMKNLDLVTTYWFGVAEANANGQQWQLASPKEGQTVWLDTLAIGKHVSGEKLKASYLLLDFMISEAVQKAILEAYGSIIVNGETANLLDPETVKKGRVGDESFFVEEFFWQPLNTRTRNMYKEMWKRARSQ